MLVSSPGGKLKAIYKCDNVSLKIFCKDFRANLIILDSKGIDVILGMGWLIMCDAVIQCAKDQSFSLVQLVKGLSLRQIQRHQPLVP
jgi:hypothetical protein